MVGWNRTEGERRRAKTTEGRERRLKRKLEVGEGQSRK